MTSSPGRMAAVATTCSAQYGSSRCQPHGRRPDTTHHDDHRHAAKASLSAGPYATEFSWIRASSRRCDWQRMQQTHVEVVGVDQIPDLADSRPPLEHARPGC